MKCPCGSPEELENCCLPFIQGQKRPQTAEALMRSRYTAYTMAEIDYIINTHDPDTRAELDADSLRDWAESSQWEGLEIRGTKAGGPEDETGMVEFVALYTDEKATTYAHHERSTFRREDDGQWYFVDGDMVEQKPYVRETPKVGRNDPCPCGSGKKYKKCCGR